MLSRNYNFIIFIFPYRTEKTPPFFIISSLNNEDRVIYLDSTSWTLRVYLKNFQLSPLEPFHNIPTRNFAFKVETDGAIPQLFNLKRSLIIPYIIAFFKYLKTLRFAVFYREGEKMKIGVDLYLRRLV